MQIEQKKWSSANGWENVSGNKFNKTADLIIIFGAKAILANTDLFIEIKNMYPGANYLGCSTAGEICGSQVLDDSLVVTAIAFEHTIIKGGKVKIENSSNSFNAGESLAKQLDPTELSHVFVLANGMKVNGSELVKGLTQNLPDNVTVTGGLAADGDRFVDTLVLWNGEPEDDTVAVLGFYGSHIKIGSGSMGG